MEDKIPIKIQIQNRPFRPFRGPPNIPVVVCRFPSKLKSSAKFPKISLMSYRKSLYPGTSLVNWGILSLRLRLPQPDWIHSWIILFISDQDILSMDQPLAEKPV